MTGGMDAGKESIMKNFSKNYRVRGTAWLIVALAMIMPCASRAQAPAWSVNPANFTFSATVTAQLNINDARSVDEYDMVAAFVGESIRGVASPLSFGNDKLYYLTVYSDSGSNEEMSLQFYSAADDMVGDIDETLRFAANTSAGSPQSPIVWNGYLSTYDRAPVMLTIPDQTIHTGGSFHSFDLDDYVVVPDNDPVRWSFGESEHLFVRIHGDHTVTVIPRSTEFVGRSEILFRVSENTPNRLSDSATVVFTVLPPDHRPLLNDIPDQIRRPGESFANFDLDDYLTEEDGDSVVYGHFFLPSIPGEAKPDWSVQAADYQYSMNITASVTSLGGSAAGEGHVLAAFAGDEVRGVATATHVLGQWLYFLSIFSNSESDTIALRFFDTSAHRSVGVAGMIPFRANEVLGSPTNPRALNAGNLIVSIDAEHVVHVERVDADWRGSERIYFSVRDAHAAVVGADTSGVTFTADGPLSAEAKTLRPLRHRLEQNYPNPFNPSTEIRFEIPEAGFVSLKIYDLLGKEVYTIVSEVREAGSYSVVWDAATVAGGLPGGVYFAKMAAGNFICVRKLLLAR